MKIILRNVRLAFPDLWAPKAFRAGDDPRYGATFIFGRDHSDKCQVFLDGNNETPTVVDGALAAVQKAIKTVAQEAWKDKSEQVLKSIEHNSNKFCFGDGDTKSEYDGFEGNMFITGRAKQENTPKIVGLDGKPITREKGVIYAGCYVNAVLDVWAQDNPTHGKGMRCGFLGLQYFRDGDAFGAGAKASEDDFEDLSDGADAPAIGDDSEDDAAGGLI